MVGRLVVCWDFVHLTYLVPWVELWGRTWKLIGTSLDLCEDSVVMLLFLLTLGT